MTSSSVATTAPAEPRFSLRDILPQQAVSIVDLATKRDVLDAVAQRAAPCAGCEPHVVFDVLWAREKLGTTAVGNGIAIPHGRVPSLTKICGCFIRLEKPVLFDAVDDKPVDLVFVLLSPEQAGADHLHALAIISRVLRDASMCARLRKAKDATEMYRILTETVSA